MRLLPFFLVLCLAFTASGNPVFDKLAEVNRCWTEQADIAEFKLPDWQPLDETGWIKLHLTLVEQRLRRRSTNHLSESQQQNRAAALNHLHEYLLAGSFPQNEDYSYRTPIFIDKYDNFCAVGYLVKATGFEQVSRMIASKTNLAYVHQMNYPELNQWAEHFGFTRDELAWIQPSYPPYHRNTCKPLGHGTDGNVFELFTDTTSWRLYVGGDFINVDSTIMAYNIAYATEANGVYTWHTLGDGLNGPVYAITKFGNQIFAGGRFTFSGNTAVNNVAYWNGSTWQPAGCLDGTVKDLIVYEGDLYAAGNFDVCATQTSSSFAKWTGTAWQPISGITGLVNTMEVYDSLLLLGGDFFLGQIGKNVAKYTTANGLQFFANNLNNEVRDFQMFKDSLYACCKRTDPNDGTLLHTLNNNQWKATFIGHHYSFDTGVTFNTFCAVEDSFLIGGNFRLIMGMGSSVRNCYNLSPRLNFVVTSDWFLVDSSINVMTRFKNKIIAGGDFKLGAGNQPWGQPQTTTLLNGICERVSNRPQYPPLIDTVIVTPACNNSNTGEITVVTGVIYQVYVHIISPANDTAALTGPWYTAKDLAPGSYRVIVIESGLWMDSTIVTVGNRTIDTGLIVTTDAITSAAAGVSYQWLDCNNGNAPIPGATNSSFKPSQTGSYAVLLTTPDSNCVYTSACVSFVPLSVATRSREGNVTVYPNPAGDYLHINLGGTHEQVQIVLTDLTGRTLITQNAEQTERLKIDIAHLPPGMYTLKVSDGIAESRHFKIAKE